MVYDFNVKLTFDTLLLQIALRVVVYNVFYVICI